MTTMLTRVQLMVFGLVAVISVSYGAVKFFGVDTVFSRPYVIEANFAQAGGIYVRADVDLLGTKVGTVREIKVGPGSGTTVVMAIDNGVELPEDIKAIIGSKSAIGEQFVELEPQSADGPLLADGDVIPQASTESPVEISQLIENLDSLAGSIPRRDLAIVLNESATAVRDIGPTIGQLLDDSNQLTKASLESVDDLTLLIDDARMVLDTQVEKGPETTAYLGNLASLTTRLLELNGALEELFGNGVDATTQITKLLQDNQEALPVLLTRLLTLTDVAADRTQGLRKTLTMFPWVLEIVATTIRPCDIYDAQTGRPVPSTCRFDEQGRPVYSNHLGLQLPENPGDPPYFACTRGYEGTVRYLPNGQPMDGRKVQDRDSPPNTNVGCVSLPTDPSSPNVRGSQNIHDYGPGQP